MEAAFIEHQRGYDMIWMSLRMRTAAAESSRYGIRRYSPESRPKVFYTGRNISGRRLTARYRAASR